MTIPIKKSSPELSQRQLFPSNINHINQNFTGVQTIKYDILFQR